MEWTLVFAGFTAFAALASGVAWLVRSLWKLSQSFAKLVEEVFGDQERPENRPGIVSRLRCIEGTTTEMQQQITRIDSEFYYNHGTSMRDKLDRVEALVDERRNQPPTKDEDE